MPDRERKGVPEHRSSVLKGSLPQGPSAHPRNTEDASTAAEPPMSDMTHCDKSHNVRGNVTDVEVRVLSCAHSFCSCRHVGSVREQNYFLILCKQHGFLIYDRARLKVTWIMDGKLKALHLQYECKKFVNLIYFRG